MAEAPRDASRPSGMPWARAIAVWLLIITVESVHGVLRVLLLQPLVGDFRARQVSVFIASALILAIACACAPWLDARSTRARTGVGLLWVVLTVAFEIGLGRGAMNASWERILSDYDLPHGGLMLFGLAFLALSPWLAARLRAWAAAKR